MAFIRRGLLLGAACLTLAASGCATAPKPPPPVAEAPPPPPPPPPPPAPPPGVSVSDSASGTTVKLHGGETLTIALSGESGSTGYAWKLLSGRGKVLGLTDHSYKSDLPPPAPGQPAVVGGGGTATFVFTAKHPGTAFVRLGLYPPGRHRHVAKIFRLKVVVSYH